MLFLILPILNLLGIKVFYGQDAFSLTVPFDKNENYSIWAILILLSIIFVSNFLRKVFLGAPFLPLRALGLGGLAACLGVSLLLLIDTFHRSLAYVRSMIPSKDETPQQTS